MSDHCSQYELEIFHLSPETLSDAEKAKITRHIGECHLCKELLGKLGQFYKELGENVDSPPTERDAAFARQLQPGRRLSLTGRKAELARKSDSLVEGFAEVIEPYRQSVIRRVIRYFRVHPGRSVGMVSFAAIALVLAFISIRPTVDKNPAIVQTKDGFLVVNNKHGDELWRKYVDPDFTLISSIHAHHPERAIRLQDVDGDGTNEVLCIYGWTAMQSPLNNLVECYNSDGSERWNYPIHRSMTIGGVLYSDQYRFYHVEAGDFTHSGFVAVLALAQHDPWNPNVLVRLDGKSGRFLSEYWHPGTLREFSHRDLDHDGVDELIYGGQNSRYQRACLAILDPRTISGSGPAPEGYYPKEIPRGTEKYYITIAPSDLMKFSSDVTNQVEQIRLTNDGMIEIIVSEPLLSFGATLYYYFDSTLNCINVKVSDSFTAGHKKLEMEKKLSTQINNEYLEVLRMGVMYWDGDKFVSQVTMNRHYNEALKKVTLP